MKVLIAASNNCRKKMKGWKHYGIDLWCELFPNCISNEKTFYKMLRQKHEVEIDIPDELCISNEQYMNWQQMIPDIRNT